MVSRPTEPAPRREPDLDSWLRTAQVATILGYSSSNVMLLVRGKKLHPRMIPGRGHGELRFDPAEVHAFASGRREKRKAREQTVTGRVAARVYRILDHLEKEDRLEVAHREIVRRVKIDPLEAQRLFEHWLLPFEEALAHRKQAEDQARRERQEERQAARDAGLERERLRAQRANARADERMFDKLNVSGRRAAKSTEAP